MKKEHDRFSLGCIMEMVTDLSESDRKIIRKVKGMDCQLEEILSLLSEH